MFRMATGRSPWRFWFMAAAGRPGTRRAYIHIPTEALTKANFTWFSINYRMAPIYLWPACFEDTEDGNSLGEGPCRANTRAIRGGSRWWDIRPADSLCAWRRRWPATIRACRPSWGLSPPTDLEFDLPQRGGLSTSLQHLLNRPKEVTEECAEDSASNVGDQLREARACRHFCSCRGMRTRACRIRGR